MPRRKRSPTDDHVYHVLNRGVRRLVLFETPSDYLAFERVLMQAVQRAGTRVLAYCAMPNHWHLVVWPTSVNELSCFMQWLTCTHAQRWHAHRGTAGTGAVYQGRYKAIPVKSDHHLLTVCRYVERNPVRAGLTSSAVAWRWSSLWRRCNYCHEGLLSEWPLPIPADWPERIDQPQTDAELEALRWAVRRSAPFGDTSWRTRMAQRLGLDPAFPPCGRPRRTDREGSLVG